jgi:hypothetical protein
MLTVQSYKTKWTVLDRDGVQVYLGFSDTKALKRLKKTKGGTLYYYATPYLGIKDGVLLDKTVADYVRRAREQNESNN